MWFFMTLKKSILKSNITEFQLESCSSTLQSACMFMNDFKLPSAFPILKCLLAEKLLMTLPGGVCHEEEFWRKRVDQDYGYISIPLVNLKQNQYQTSLILFVYRCIIYYGSVSLTSRK